MAKALGTLKEVAANQTAFIVAVKDGHKEDRLMRRVVTPSAS
jgi:hypothetical protein